MDNGSMRNKQKGGMKKRVLSMAAGLFCFIILAIGAWRYNYTRMVKRMSTLMEQQMGIVDDMFREAENNIRESEIFFNDICISKAETIAYAARESKEFRMDDFYLRDLRDQLLVQNIVILDREGNVLARAVNDGKDYRRAIFNELRTVFFDGKGSGGFAVNDIDTVDNFMAPRYYAARIDNDREVVICKDSFELFVIHDRIFSWESLLEDMKQNVDCTAFAVSMDDYSILYYPEREMQGEDVTALGLSPEVLTDSFIGHIKMNNSSYYLGVREFPEYGVFLCFALSFEARYRNAVKQYRLVLLACVLLILTLTCYSLFSISDWEMLETVPDEREKRRFAGRLGFILITGCIGILLFTIYIGRLFRIYQLTLNVEGMADKACQAAELTSYYAKFVQELYDVQYISKASQASWFLSEDPSLLDPVKLRGLSYKLGAEYMVIYDMEGKEVLSDSSYRNLSISSNPDDPSYDFQRLMLGKPTYVQDILEDPLTGEREKKVGSLLYDKKGAANGFVIISFLPWGLESEESRLSLNSAMGRFGDRENSFAIALDKETGVVKASGKWGLEGQDAASVGIKDSHMDDMFNGFLKLPDGDYLAACTEADEIYCYYVYSRELIGIRSLEESLDFAVILLPCFIFFLYPVLVLDSIGIPRFSLPFLTGQAEEGQIADGVAGRSVAPLDGVSEGSIAPADSELSVPVLPADGVYPANAAENGVSPAGSVLGENAVPVELPGENVSPVNGGGELPPLRTEVPLLQADGGRARVSQDLRRKAYRSIEVILPDGSRKHTISAWERWSIISDRNGRLRVHEKIFLLLRWIRTSIGICLGLLFLNRIRLDPDESLFRFVVDADWAYGLNIYAVTACFFTYFILSAADSIIRRLLRLLAVSLDSQGETVCRMLSSFCRYSVILVQIFLCLTALGADTRAMLASAGIFSLVIGLGARPLISDIIAGLFIIFESEFRVGDIIQDKNGYRGMVQEIGVRSTKLVDDRQNVKVICNSELSNIINMTKKLSYAVCDIQLDTKISLEEVEEILQRELPSLPARLSGLIGLPKYEGVVALNAMQTIIRVSADCEESMRVQLTNELYREIRLVFEKCKVGNYGADARGE